MSLTRIATDAGPRAAAVALDLDPELHGPEFLTALAAAWQRRNRPDADDRRWLEVRHHLPFPLGEDLHRMALGLGQHTAAQALADILATQRGAAR